MKSPALVILAALLGVAAASADTYRSVPLDALVFEGPKEQLATELEQEVMASSFLGLDARMEAEAYLDLAEPDDDSLVQGKGLLLFKGEAKLPLKGVIDLAGDYTAGDVRSVGFTILEGTTQEIAEKDFLEARARWAGARAEAGVAGVAWFRHLEGHPPTTDEALEEALGGTEASLSETFSLFSGGRSIAENLSLRRDLILARGADEENVRIDTIEGIAVKAIDWSRRLPKGEVAVDPLSLAIPEDQHAFFVPSLPVLLGVLDRLDGEADLLLSSVAGNNPWRGLIPRYRRQLGLDVTDAAARLLPVRSVAVTGGDLYFATGTDVAVLMESERPAALFKALELAIRAQAGSKPESHALKGDMEWLSFVLPEKGISSHLCRMGDLVFVTNSPAQVRRLGEVAERLVPSLGRSDEFRFFRHRYPAQGESAFLFLSDATIRRWAGPVTRIGASRRNRALAALNELTCRGIVECKLEDDYAPLLGRVALLKGRAISEHFGSAEFLTPISELGLTEVSALEKEAYLLWKGGYEGGWGQFFDPIAVQLTLTDDSVDVGLTILPLNVNDELRGVMDLVGDAALTEGSRMRPAGSVLRLAFAVDSKAEFFKQFETSLISLLPDLKIKPLSWMGDSVSVDCMDSLCWQGLGSLFMDGGYLQLPVVGRIEVKSKIKLSLFLTALRTMLSTDEPDALLWLNRKHGEHPYVVVTEREPSEFRQPIRICYAVVGDALLCSLSERHLKQAIDFEAKDWPPGEIARLPQAKGILLDASPSLLSVIDQTTDPDGPVTSRSCLASWKAIPVLNEWHRRFPGRDPVALHQQMFGVTLHCPGGRGYQWNARQRTMESVVYGHRGAPREPQKKSGLNRYGRVTSALDFEDDGLRLKLHLGPATPLPQLPDPPVGKVLGKAMELCSYQPGRALSYVTTGPNGDEIWGTEVVAVEDTPNGQLVSTRESWAYEGEQGFWEGRYRIDAQGVWQLGGKDEFSTSTYAQPSLLLPTLLKQDAVHRGESKGTNSYEDNGVKEVDDFINRTEIRVLGTETVEVPAGKFKDCVVIERCTEDLWGDQFDSDVIKEWYHPGTGAVQSLYQDGTLSKLSKIEQKKAPEEP